MDNYYPVRPKREPDYVLESSSPSSGWWLAFWWEEKIQTNNVGFIHEIDVENMMFRTGNGNWYRFGRSIMPIIKDAYFSYLLEKEMGLRRE